MMFHFDKAKAIRFIALWGQHILVGVTIAIMLTATILVVISALDSINRMNNIIAQLPNIIHQEMQQTRQAYKTEENSTRQVTIQQREETTKTLVQSVKETVQSTRPIVINQVPDNLHPMQVIVVKAPKESSAIMTITPAPKIPETIQHPTVKLPVATDKLPPAPRKKKRILFWHVGK